MQNIQCNLRNILQQLHEDYANMQVKLEIHSINDTSLISLGLEQEEILILWTNTSGKAHTQSTIFNTLELRRIFNTITRNLLRNKFLLTKKSCWQIWLNCFLDTVIFIKWNSFLVSLLQLKKISRIRMLKRVFLHYRICHPI